MAADVPEWPPEGEGRGIWGEGLMHDDAACHTGPFSSQLPGSIDVSTKSQCRLPCGY